MPDPNLQAYIASHYLSGPKADATLRSLSSSSSSHPDAQKKKKKRRKVSQDANDAAGMVVIRDHDEQVLDGTQGQDLSDSDVPIVTNVSEQGVLSKGFRKVGTVAKQQGRQGELANDSAMSTATPSTSAATGLQQAAGPDSSSTTATDMLHKPGLRSKAEMRAARLARQQQAALQPSTSTSNRHGSTERGREDENREEDEGQRETVYRDASGRVIDVRQEQEEAERQAQARRRLEESKKTWNQGLVQRAEAASRQAQFEKSRAEPIQSRIGDGRVDQYLKERNMVDDPAKNFLTKKRAVQKYPKYQGSFVPSNRFNILPGYRWDGVDRSNGFEKLLLQRKAELDRRRDAAHAWSREDM